MDATPRGSGSRPPRAPLALERYREALALDEPFTPAEGPALTEAEADALARALVTELAAWDGAAVGPLVGLPPRTALYRLLTARPPSPFPPGALEALDRLGRFERGRRPVVSPWVLPRLQGHEDCALWRGDLTTLAVDAAVNAANSALLGCFVPHHACVDNALHAAAGPRMRADCATLRSLQGTEEPVGFSKATRGYHLPARFVLHTVGPAVPRGRAPGSVDREALGRSYRACLELAAALPSVRSVGF